MKLQALSTLTEVVRRGSFAAAAQAIHVTPSAVSLQMKQLETYFGQALFDRSSRTAKPTQFAIEVAERLSLTLGQIDGLRQRHQPALQGHVRLGVTESMQTTLLPKAFASLRHAARGVELVLARGSTPALLEDLKAGRLDAAVLVRPPGGGSSRLHWQHLYSQTFVLVAPARLSGGKPINILQSEPWIRLDRDLIAGRLAARYVHAVAPQQSALIDVPGIDAIVAMVAEGIGVSVLPSLRPAQLLAGEVVEIELGRQAPARDIALVRRKTDSDNRLLDIVQQCFLNAAQSVAAAAASDRRPKTPSRRRAQTS